MRVQAVWKGAVLAESNQTILVEGNYYFPPNSINHEYFIENERHTVCPWKGLASYYDVEVDGKVNHSAAWYYPDPSPAARHILNYVAFWNGVKVRPVSSEAKSDSESFVKRALSGLFG